MRESGRRSEAGEFRQEPMPCAVAAGALLGQAWQVDGQDQEHDAQMRDAVEPRTVGVPNAKRQSTSNLANGDDDTVVIRN